MATNILARFRRLLPGEPLLIATVDSVDAASGTSIVSFAAGGTTRVFGADNSIGDKVFLRGGMIIETAPAMTHYELEA